MTSQPLSVELRFNLSVNNSTFHFRGFSRGTPGEGMPMAVLDSADALPKGFHVSLLSYVALTGHPFMSRSTAGAQNPFLRTGGIYSAVRTLDLGSRGALSTAYRVENGPT